jgi:hypothetical protein
MVKQREKMALEALDANGVPPALPPSACVALSPPLWVRNFLDHPVWVRRDGSSVGGGFIEVGGEVVGDADEGYGEGCGAGEGEEHGSSSGGSGEEDGVICIPAKTVVALPWGITDKNGSCVGGGSSTLGVLGLQVGLPLLAMSRTTSGSSIDRACEKKTGGAKKTTKKKQEKRKKIRKNARIVGEDAKNDERDDDDGGGDGGGSGSTSLPLQPALSPPSSQHRTVEHRTVEHSTVEEYEVSFGPGPIGLALTGDPSGAGGKDTCI